MGSNRDNNYISIGSWMFMMLITAIPVIGWIMILVWAFTGDNESRKNYYRAILAWLLVGVLLIVGLIAAGVGAASWPEIRQHFQAMRHRP